MYSDNQKFGLPSIFNYEKNDNNLYGSANPSNLTQVIKINPKYDPNICYSNLNKSKKSFIYGMYDKYEDKIIFFNDQQENSLLEKAENARKLGLFDENKNHEQILAIEKNLNNKWKKQEKYVEKDKITKFIPDMVSTKMRTRYFFPK